MNHEYLDPSKTYIFSADEMSNEEYHNNKSHVSGSFLSKLHFGCPAKAKFEPKKDASHFVFGTTAHTNILEIERFNKEFIRKPEPSEFKDLITSQDGMRKFLKAQGVAKYSTMSVDELIAAIKATGIDVPIWHEIEKNLADEAQGRIIVPGKDYDRTMQMREVIMSNGALREVVLSGSPEISIFTTIGGVPVKVRLDRFTQDRSIVDYKTTRDASPEGFGRLAYNLGYYLKMALQYDVTWKAMKQQPTGIKLLAQEHEEPFIAKMYRMSEWQINLGRDQYRAAAAIFKRCKETDSWPVYGLSNDEMELPTPEWVKAKNK